jgi:ubiquinone biosynthesis protein COQ9
MKWFRPGSAMMSVFVSSIVAMAASRSPDFD